MFVFHCLFYFIFGSVSCSFVLKRGRRTEFVEHPLHHLVLRMSSQFLASRSCFLFYSLQLCFVLFSSALRLCFFLGSLTFCGSSGVLGFCFAALGFTSRLFSCRSFVLFAQCFSCSLILNDFQNVSFHVRILCLMMYLCFWFLFISIMHFCFVVVSSAGLFCCVRVAS